LKLWKIISLLLIEFNMIVLGGVLSTNAEETTVMVSDDLSSAAQQTMPIIASDTSRVYTVTSEGTIEIEPNAVMFWEYPQIPAGQLRKGMITVKNETQSVVLFSLSSIDLPYNNEEALLYLTYLHITVTHNKEILYDGKYSGIVDSQGGLKLEVEINPGDEEEIEVSLRCSFDYMATPPDVTDTVYWIFQSVPEFTESEQSQSKDTWIVLGLKIGASVLIVIGLVFYGFQVVQKNKRKRMKH
jgi:hypothetical protein